MGDANYGMYASMFSSAFSSIGNAYSQYQWSKANQTIADLEQQVNETLAGISLTQALNTTQKAVTETMAHARRQEAKLERESIAAHGAATVEAAASGAAGQRVQLAREQATYGAADRTKAEMKSDVKRELDAIMEQETQATAKVISQLLAAPVDVPSDFDVGAAVLDFTSKTYSIYTDWERFEAQRKAGAEG